MPFPVTKDRALRLDQPAEAERFLLINSAGGDRLYYGASPQTSATNNEGSLAAGSTLELSSPKYVISAGNSLVILADRTDSRTGLQGIEVASKEEAGDQGVKAILEANGSGVSIYDSSTETWEPRPAHFKRVTFVSPIHGAPDPADAEAFDEVVEPSG